MSKTITIYTDASYSIEYKISAYAFRIILDNIVISATGPIKNACKPHESEMSAIANALHFLLRLQVECDRIAVKTDSELSIHGLKGRCIIAVSARDAAKQLGVPVSYTHIRAHTGKADADSINNHWCDLEARKTLRENVAARKAAL